MKDLRIAAAQFEHRSADREYNLSRIRELTFSGGVAAYALDSARGKRFNWMISATLVVVLFGLWGVFS